eukprot:2103037-Karenia_brevis.AAC.1
MALARDHSPTGVAGAYYHLHRWVRGLIFTGPQAVDGHGLLSQAMPSTKSHQEPTMGSMAP